MSRASKVSERKRQIRDHLFPGAKNLVWNRKVSDGYTSVPRAMPLILRIMDEMSKGTPPSAVYFDLWMYAWDEMFIVIDNPKVRAYYSGFSGQRDVATWVQRMRILLQQGFIQAKAGAAGEFTNVLLVDPYKVIEALEKRKTRHAGLDQVTLNTYHSRLVEVGAED